MVRDDPYVAEISALRFQLLGSGESMLGAMQYACRRYMGILTKMVEQKGRDADHLMRLRDTVADISERIDRTALYRNERVMADSLQRFLTELRMLIDMHLHSLSADGR